MHSLAADLRFALRAFLRQKGATALILITLSLAVAANVSVYSLLDGLFFRPFAFPESERLVYLNERAPKWNLDFVGIDYKHFHEWRQKQRSFSAMGLFQQRDVNLSDGDVAERVSGALVTHDFAAALGIQPLLGRTFTAEEDTPQPPELVMIGEGLWHSRFAGSRDVIGKTLRINSRAYTIIGVMPRSAEFPRDVRLWALLGGDPNEDGESFSYDGVARLKPGVTLEQAQADMRLAHANIWATSDTGHVVSPLVMPLRDRFVADFRVVGKTLGAAALLVLLIACANVAGAMLARAVFRQRELGIRVALGANAARITRQLLTESLLLAVVAGAVGTLVGWWGIRAFVASASELLPGWITVSADARGVAFAVAVVLGTALLFGLVPALQSRRVDVRGALSASGTRSSASVPQRRMLDALVAIEVALAVILLVGSGLLLRAHSSLLKREPGFRVDGVLSFGVVLPDAKYDSAPAQHAFYERALSRLRTIPGVRSAAAITCPPLTCHWGYFMEAEHAAPRGRDDIDPVVLLRVATSDYFTTAGIPLVRGRFFDGREGDRQGGRRPSELPIVVNESFARRHWPGNSNPIGERVKFRGDTSNRWRTVVGITKDERHYGLDEDPRPGMYMPFQSWPELQSLRFVIAANGDPRSLYAPIRSAMRELDPELPVYQLKSMREMLDLSLARRRTVTSALIAFAAIALVLAISGVYAVVSYVVGRRRQELGIRMALGAQRGEVLRYVVTQGLRLVVIGLVVGVPAAYASATVLSSLLVGVSRGDLLTYLVVSALLSVTGVVAAVIPARRAASVAPTVALGDGG